MTNEEIKKILENHQHWLNKDVDGWREMRADFTGADLEGADLRSANLVGAYLGHANLVSANLERAYFGYANLRDANLRDAHIVGADLREANLEKADFTGADLEGADLRSANLAMAILRDANLVGAYLGHANLRDANLRDANLRDAHIVGADLRNAENVPFVPMACPDEGSFIGWKKAFVIDCAPCIIKLHIPEDAKRSSATGRKCRCNKAKVLSITHILSGKSYDIANSIYDKHFIYKVGEYVEVDNFDEDRFNECAPGIHFFINKQEAINN